MEFLVPTFLYKIQAPKYAASELHIQLMPDREVFLVLARYTHD